MIRSSPPGSIAATPADRVGGRERLLLLSLYTTQTLALMFFVAALIAILAEAGADMDRLTQVYMLGLVWPAKLLWAPLVDRVRFGHAGHYRAWAIIMQAAMVVVLAVMAGFDPLDDFSTVYVLCLALALLSATQDVAVDGLACRLLPVEARGSGNALQIAGGLLGTMVGAGGVLALYPHLGWPGAMALLAAVTGVSLVQLLAFREPGSVTAVITPPPLRRRLAGLRRPDVLGWTALLLIWPAGSGMAYALIMPALVEAGWSMERIGLVVNVAGPMAGILGALAAGRIAGRIGRRPALILAALVQLAGIAVVAVPVLSTGEGWLPVAAVCLYFLFYNPGATVMAMVMMDRASTARPATDYSLQATFHAAVGMGSISTGAAIAAAGGAGATLQVAGIAGLLALMGAVLLRHPSGGRS
ncbi:MFS transporter [Tistrella mobilis]|uniref:Major facilitator transporter n=1 Tax=Tistrella mobilis (strain KA081020-065) TaxID=1110502 RepID=I3TQS9_TISMK|nr:MFS transporter [Tistrella mobilis]AFK55117.1 major facilitator transporter [Tistrella mobilis KA081020-065]